MVQITMLAPRTPHTHSTRTNGPNLNGRIERYTHNKIPERTVRFTMAAPRDNTHRKSVVPVGPIYDGRGKTQLQENECPTVL